MADRSKAEKRLRGDTEKADPEQYARFVEKARELGCDDDPAKFDELVRRIAKAKPRPPRKTGTGES